METTRPPGFPGNPPARMPRASTPARSLPPRPLRSGDVAFRPTHDVGPRTPCISGLNHAAYGLPVNASRPGSPQAHASLGSGWRPTLAGWDWLPTGFRTRFQRSHHVILSPLTGLSRHTRCCMKNYCGWRPCPTLLRTLRRSHTTRRFALGLERVDARLDLLVTALDRLVVAVVHLELLAQHEEVFIAIVTRERGGDLGFRRLAPGVAMTSEHCGIGHAGHNVAQDQTAPLGRTAARPGKCPPEQAGASNRCRHRYSPGARRP